MANQGVPYPTIVKVRDALSSILRAAVEDELLVKNPMEGLKLPPDKRPRRAKPFISPEQFNSLVQLIPEPYATAVYVCVWTFQHSHRAQHCSLLRFRDAPRVDFLRGTDTRVPELSLHGLRFS